MIATRSGVGALRIAMVAIVCALGVHQAAVAALIVSDDFEGKKLDPAKWAPQDTWDADNGVLKIQQIAGDGNGPGDFGYGVDAFTNFGLQLDFKLASEPQASKIEILFRATELSFYQLIITPANGFGRKNSARWYKREGPDRATWNEYVDFRADLPFTVTTDVWYSLGLLGDRFDFELHLKERGAVNATLVSAWTEPKGLHPEGTFGIHTNQGHHYEIDNFFLYDNPNNIQGFLPVEAGGKAAVKWASLKR